MGKWPHEHSSLAHGPKICTLIQWLIDHMQQCIDLSYLIYTSKPSQIIRKWMLIKGST